MATDNPLLAGMLGGIELARATMGSQLAQQQATMQNVLQMQQMQLQAAQSRQQFEAQQANILAATRLNEFKLRQETQQAAAAVELAKIEAPVKQAELTARLQEAQTKSATSMMEFNKLAVANQAERIYSGLSAVTFGIGDPAQSRAVSQQFFQSQQAALEKLPEDQRPLAAQGLRAALTRYQTEEMERAKMARADAAKMISEFTQFASSTQDETAVKATKELYAAQLADLSAKTGVDMTSTINILKGTAPAPGSIVDVTKPTFKPTLAPKADVTVPQVQAPAVETRMASVDERLDRLAQSATDPALKAEALNARRRLEAVRMATAEGFPTTQRGGGLSFRPTGFGGLRGRTLTQQDLAALEQMQDPREINQFLNQFVAPIPQVEFGDTFPTM